MDGFELMVKTPVWAALKKAQDAVFEAQCSFERNCFASEFLLESRLKLKDAENQLRRHFRVEAEREMERR